MGTSDDCPPGGGSDSFRLADKPGVIASRLDTREQQPYGFAQRQVEIANSRLNEGKRILRKIEPSSDHSEGGMGQDGTP